VMVAFYWSC